MLVTTYGAAIGGFVRRVRKDHGLTLEAVANAGRNFGATWNTASIRNLEAGRMSPTLPNLLILALAIGELTGTPVALHDLLDEATEFNLPTTANESVSRHWVNLALQGKPVVPPAPKSPNTPITPPTEEGLSNLQGEPAQQRPGREDLPPSYLQSLIDQRELYKSLGIILQPEQRKVMEDEIHRAMLDEQQNVPEREKSPLPKSATMAEERAAKKLGITPAKLQHIAHTLWGTSLEDEAAHRAGDGSTPQARGLRTRQLQKEIAEEIQRNGSSS